MTKDSPVCQETKGGRVRRCCCFSVSKLIYIIATNKYIFLLFYRVSGVYLGALGVQAQLENRLGLNNQHMHDEEALSETLITF